LLRLSPYKCLGGLAVVEELNPSDPLQVGPYRLIGRLGSGGMGRVFLGRSRGGRLVAVKVIHPELAQDRDFRVRFAREFAAASKVSGVYTAPVVDADMDAPQPWLATAYVRGPSLGEAVSQEGPLPDGALLDLAAGLAEGLGAIHAAQVVHRDLKPSNVLLAEDGPRVIDFGVSVAAEASKITGTGLVVGSPGFMSPEQADGAEVDAASDVFSLGAVLVYAACGEGPFGAGPTAAVVYRIVHAQPRLGQVPAQIRALVERCLAKDPAGRPSTMQILAELEAAPTAAPGLAGWLGPRLPRLTSSSAISPPQAHPSPPPGSPAKVSLAGSSGGPPTQTAVTRQSSRRSAAPPPPGRPESGRKPRLRSGLAWLTGSLVVLGLAITFVIVSSLPNHSPPAARSHNRPGSRTSTRTSAHRVPSPSQKSALKLVIDLTAVQDCWVDVTLTSTGQQIYQGVVEAGSTMAWTEHQPVTVSLGNPAGVELTVNGTNPVPRGDTSPVTLTLPLRG
jgi:serine/threonine protein kinase